jgi:hypothetical protein
MPRAKTDIACQVDWLQAATDTGVERWLKSLDVAIEAIRRNPQAYGIAAESAANNVELREKLFGTARGAMYRLLYVISEQEILILRVRGPGQARISSSDL